MKNKLDKRGNLYELNNDIKAFAKAVILSYDCFNSLFFSFIIWGRGIRGCFTAADNQSEKNKLKLPLAKFRNALQQVLPSALVVYPLVKDDEQKKQSHNKVEGEGLCILVA